MSTTTIPEIKENLIIVTSEGAQSINVKTNIARSNNKLEHMIGEALQSKINCNSSRVACKMNPTDYSDKQSL
jgi:hypothetical protein